MKLAVRREIDLAGTWAFTPEGGTPAVVEVPGGGWLKQGFDCEAATYERHLDVPFVAEAQVTRVELGAVNHLAEYSIGVEGGRLETVHREVTAFTPQVVDVSAAVEPGRRHLLRIFVRSHRDGRAIAPHNFEGWPIPRGIFREAKLRVYPSVFIDDVVVTTRTVDDTLSYEVWVRNGSGSARKVEVAGALEAWDGGEWRYPLLPTVEVELAAGERRRVEVGRIGWGLGRESYWWPNTPYREGYRARLHVLRIGLVEGGREVHEARVRFGFRQIRQEGAQFTLNGVRVNFRGDSLQVANYDKIDNGGRGDAIDTLGGFLPPTGDNPGWPKAVDNYLRLNFNLQRAHRQPWTPYMLDVCDELGLMVMGEGACGWYEYDRAYHEMKCLGDMVRRDRNHPSVVRWSLKNEPICPDPEYHEELYEAVKSEDDTRPICIHIGRWNWEIYDPDKMFSRLKDRPDFTWMEQFLSFDKDRKPYYTQETNNTGVVSLTDRPFGLGGGLWPHCSTAAGLVLFATMIALVRAEGACDVRPYVLLSSWASSVPGVRSTDFVTEEGRYPVYGEDNLKDPWGLFGIQLIQKACDPLLAFDYEFWKLNENSNAAGSFPVVVPQISANARVEREIVVFNDELCGSSLELVWEAREESASNKVLDQGRRVLRIRPGHLERVVIAFTSSKLNCSMFLTLRVHKGGRERFVDSLTCYRVVGGEDYRYWGYGDNTSIPDAWLKRQR